MIITVLWEDSRGVVRKGFGAHDLLVACVAEKTDRDRFSLRHTISSKPLKGAGNVVKELRDRLPLLSDKGPVFAVLDRDKACELWPGTTDCKAAIRARIEEKVGSGYDLVLLEQNMESLIEVCDPSAFARLHGIKPTPDQRDGILGKAASDAAPVPRETVLTNCPSFARLVYRVAAKLAPGL
jgi:hypothetical protein